MDWRAKNLARQYLASERGALVRDWGGRAPIVLCYPNGYSVGMSSLAMHGLYRWFNALPGILCERAFAWLDRPAPEAPLATLESQRPLGDAAVLAFTVSFELDYFHVIEMLRRAGLPMLAVEREEGDPLVLLGGPAVAANPEPLAPMADAIIIGEIEPILAPLGEALRGSFGQRRDEILAHLAGLPGVYVPALHQGQPIARLWQPDLEAFPLSTTIHAPRAEFGDMHLIEISRGCGRGCRFCLAGQWYRPMRERSIASIVAQAQEGLRQVRKLGLVAAAVSDHSQIEELVARLRTLGAAISLSSLRVHPLPRALVEALAASGSRSITLAPEAGSERLRQAIHKGITQQHVLDAAQAVQGKFDSLKLYFMVGLPGEEDSDIDELLALSDEVARIFQREVVVNVTPFVPKAHTAFEREPMASADALGARLVRLRTGCKARGLVLRAEGLGEARVQAALARGDRALGLALAGMVRLTPNRLEGALEAVGLDLERYLAARPAPTPLPWDFIEA